MLHFFWCGYRLAEHSFNLYEYANLEIAKWAEYYLSQKTAFHQSTWEAGRVTDNPSDVLLGHPTWDIRAQTDRDQAGKLLRNWVKDNALLPTQAAHPNTYILMPWVPEMLDNWVHHMPFYPSQLLAARKIFAICGEIWIQKTIEKKDDSIESLVKDKLVRCNMGVAAQNIPVFKQSFNKIGERQLLHISNLAAYKGFDLTCESLLGLDTLLHVASPSFNAPIGLVEVELAHDTFVFNHIGRVSNSDPAFNQWAIENCDFYIHTGQMDAQATVILENCVRGLIPLVTPESGFASPHATYLTHDPDQNRQIIEQALNLPEAELLQRSRLVREQVIREHNWKDIFERIWESIQADVK